MTKDPSRDLASIQERGVPLLDLKRQYEPLHQEIIDALTRVCESGCFVLGPEIQKLEQTMADYSHATHGVACASGSDALLLALMAYDIGPGDEVILPSFTFFATASAVTRLGATPVFADICPKSFNMDPSHVEKLMTSRTKALLPVHLFGQMADMDALNGLGADAGIPVIEDAAQAIGAELDGRRAGSVGTIGCFSFYPTKNLGAAGDGGMLTTNDDALAKKLALLRVHGMSPRYYHPIVGVNSRLDAFQGAVLNVKIQHIDTWTDMRAKNSANYTKLFQEAGLDQWLQLPVAEPNRRHVWNQYVVRVPNGQRDEVRAFLGEAKIAAEIYYPLGLHKQECFAYLGYGEGDLPETDLAAEEVLALPMFPELMPEEQQVLVNRMSEFFEKKVRSTGAVGAPHYLQQREKSPHETADKLEEK